MSSMRDQLWPVFIAEVADQLEGLDVALEPGADDPARVDVNALFRYFHTVKSNGSMMDFASMERLAHACEDLLFVLRENGMAVDNASFRLLGRAVDALKTQLVYVTDHQQNPPLDEPLVAALVAHADAQRLAVGLAMATDVDDAAAPAVALREAAPLASADVPLAEETMRVSGQTLDELVASVGHMAMCENAFSHVVNNEEIDSLLARSRQLLDQLQPGAVNAEDIALVGDLFAAFDLYQGRVSESDHEIRSALARIEQDVMDLRVVPISVVFNRLPVLVRKTSESSHKEVDLVMEGGEVKVDKRMVDTLMEPLVHIIRNAIDHGIEPPAEREQKGKPVVGVVTVRAEQDAGMLRLEIVDDGKGLDPVRIEAKARKLGLIGAADVNLSPARINELIFLPGFSTSDAVTETSGRGVGMDVVKTRITSLGGSVEVSSVVGQQTRFRLSLPLSVAIQGVVLVRAARETFALPLQSVREIVSFAPEDLQVVNGQSVVMFRGAVLPLCTLGHLLGRAEDIVAGSSLEVVVLNRHDEWLGVVLDTVLGRQDLIVREVHPDLARLPGLGGVSLLGDGRVVIILDVEHLFRMAATHAQLLEMPSLAQQSLLAQQSPQEQPMAAAES